MDETDYQITKNLASLPFQCR